jgi:hypothetical protein
LLAEELLHLGTPLASAPAPAEAHADLPLFAR